MTPVRDIILLDGAMGSELERRGSDTALPLWSARALLEHPELVARIHREYLEAGAGAITTSTFRTHRRSLSRARLGNRAEVLTRQAVEIAQRTRDDVNPQALVLGSVAPLEDCYEPHLAPDADICAAEHAEMIGRLCEAGVDGLLIETMNNAAEAEAAAARAAEKMPDRYIVSCCTRIHATEPTFLSGEPVLPLLRALERPWAVGINCVPAPAIAEQVRFLRAQIDPAIRISAYANVGRPDPERGWINTDAIDPVRYADYAGQWIRAGATIVGGCCGTTPATIRAIADRLDSA